jgi:hypothetical protein
MILAFRTSLYHCGLCFHLKDYIEHLDGQSAFNCISISTSFILLLHPDLALSLIISLSFKQEFFELDFRVLKNYAQNISQEVDKGK